MLEKKNEIEDILNYYSIGSLVKIKAKLDAGFQSENFHIVTEKGDFVIRELYDSKKNVNISMRVYEYLASNGLKIPKPIRTKDNQLFLSRTVNEFIGIQTFIEGSPEINNRKINELLPSEYHMYIPSKTQSSILVVD